MTNKLKLFCTILRCRRCDHLIRKDELIIINKNMNGERWKCPDCGSTVDAILLRTDKRLRKNRNIQQHEERQHE